MSEMQRDGLRHTSTLADHPDVAPVLPRFVKRLPGQVARLRELLAAGNRGELQRLVHQVRGMGSSFGFAGMTDLAAEVEEMLLAARPWEEVVGGVERLAGYMEDVEGYGT
jgi:HPt (histidine-containing phosphotransfer) domain-containing protein